ncbi:hypothetical protein DXA50_18655, partial [Butyricimonas virosa]
AGVEEGLTGTSLPLYKGKFIRRTGKENFCQFPLLGVRKGTYISFGDFTLIITVNLYINSFSII